MGHDRYYISRHIDATHRNPPARRSLSPHKLEGSGKVLHGDGRSRLIERREYDSHLGRGRINMARSRSPLHGQMQKRFCFDGGFVHRKYENPESMDFGDCRNSRTKHAYGRDHDFSRTSKGKDFGENRIVCIEEHGILGQNLLPMEDGSVRGSYCLPPDLGPTSNYREIGRHVPSLSRSLDIGRLEHEGLHYQETIPLEKLRMMESYREEDNLMCSSRDISYNMVLPSHSKDFMSTSQYDDIGSTSSGISMSEVLVSYRDSVSLCPEEYGRSIEKLVEPVGHSTYIQRPLFDTVRGPEAVKRNMTLCQRGAYSPTRAEHEDYFYTKSQEIGNGNHAYQPGGFDRMIPSHTHVDYNHLPIQYDHRDLSRPSGMHPIAQKINNNEDSYENMRKSSILDHPALQKQIASDCLEISRSNQSKQDGEFLRSGCAHVELRRRVSLDNEISNFDVLKEPHVSYPGSDMGYSRMAGPLFHKEILQGSSISRYDSEMRPAPKIQRTKEGVHGINEPSDRILKRKYSIKDDICRPCTRTVVSSKWNVPEDFHDQYDTDEAGIDADMIGLHSSERERFQENEYREVRRKSNWREYHRDFESGDWLSSQDSLELARRPSVRFSKQSGKYMKHHPRTGSSSIHGSHRTDGRGGLDKYQKVWKRKEDYDEGVHENDAATSEDFVNPPDSEPSEDSGEFKLLVHEAFLKYSKRLNANPAVKRRYKEQGKAGTLFCIVCGRSLSKEFMDTQRLVTHAFMSPKAGLRAKHLGLHKAICVLMGWNAIVPHNTITWVPQVLPDAEALAEKEDLILWPPAVVIHNISMSDNTPREQKVIPIESMEAFLKGKGFVGGKVILGRPADQSIMVVKFLETFSGLANAEKLHKYFAEKRHGRVDFDCIASGNSKTKILVEAGRDEDKLGEDLLYGYMGIAEDLDKVDFNTKKRSSIKSKKDIQELANAPVKPDER